MSKAMWVIMAVAILSLPHNLYAQCCCCSGAQAQQTQTQGKVPTVKPPAAPGAQGIVCPFSQESSLHAKKAEKQVTTKLANQGKDDPKTQGK
jgi:hypothetical protein